MPRRSTDGRRLASWSARAHGRALETAVAARAAAAGLLLVTHGQRARHLPGGRVIVQRSDLDFAVYAHTGRSVVFDAKNFPGDSFLVSALTKHQVQRALAYAAHNVAAGFLIYLREHDRVVFYPVCALVMPGRRPRVHADEGILLGGLADFDLSQMFPIEAP